MEGEINTVRRRIFFSRMAAVVFVVSVMTIGVLLFMAIERYLTNMKFAYVTGVYAPLVAYETKEIFKDVVGVASAAAGLIEWGKETRSDDSSNEAIGNSRTVSIPVLLYHGIIPKADGTDVTIDNFREQMFALKRAGYEAVSMSDVLGYMKGENLFPPKPVVITFDDGRKDSYYPTDPIFKALGYKAVIYVVTQYSFFKEDSHYYLVESELKKMNESGRWEIEAHAKEGHTYFPIDKFGDTGHFYTNLLWKSGLGRLETPEEQKLRIRNDLGGAYDDIAGQIGKPPISFAVPFGDLGQNSKNYKDVYPVFLSELRARYSVVVSQDAPSVMFRQNYFDEIGRDSASFLLRRISVSPDWSADDLLVNLESSRAKELPYSDDFDVAEGWIPNTWGKIDSGKGYLRIGADQDTTGSVAVLDGTRGWKDYDMRAHISSVKGSNFYLWVRVADSENYAACNFGRDLAHVEQTVNGERRVIRGNVSVLRPYSSEEGFSGTQDIEARAVVNGRTLECYYNGQLVVKSDFLDPSLSSGGAGFKVWDEKLGESDLMIDKFEVTAPNAF